MTTKNVFLCLDCGIDTGEIDHYYMIHDELWLSVNPNSEGMLCYPCLEERLGRKLTYDDFKDVPLTYEPSFLLPFLHYIECGEVASLVDIFYLQRQ